MTSSSQYKVVLAAPTLDLARSASGQLNELLDPPPLAVTEFEAGGGGYIVEAYFENSPDLAALTVGLQPLIEKGLGAPRVEPVPDANWVTISQAALPPVYAGRFVVHGSHDRDKIGRRSNAILIDAGEAFGTAHHATTEGCLLAIDHLAHRLSPATVVDLGCGTGVLAIAAQRAFPRASVVASDIDPIATDVARANMIANGAGQQIDVVTSVGFDHPVLRPQHQFDLVIANILAAPLVVLAKDMRRSLAPAGVVVMSGLLATQAAEVATAYRAQGFALYRRRDIAGWSTLIMQFLHR